MRTNSIASIAYTPDAPPSDDTNYRMYLQRELQKLSAVIALLAAGHIEKSYAAPTKPREGDIRFADGTTWNPGSGIGVYVYKAGTWAFLG